MYIFTFARYTRESKILFMKYTIHSTIFIVKSFYLCQNIIRVLFMHKWILFLSLFLSFFVFYSAYIRVCFRVSTWRKREEEREKKTTFFFCYFIKLFVYDFFFLHRIKNFRMVYTISQATTLFSWFAWNCRKTS